MIRASMLATQVAAADNLVDKFGSFVWNVEPYQVVWAVARAVVLTKKVVGFIIPYGDDARKAVDAFVFAFAMCHYMKVTYEANYAAQLVLRKRDDFLPLHKK